MCGRFSFAFTEKHIEEHFCIIPTDLTPRYNCAPSQLLAAITNEKPDAFSFLKWGFIPFWAKDATVGYKMINAKAETITEKPAFRNAIRTKRCLIPADSFYEWSHLKDKMPYRMMLKDQPLFSMAGIWNEWKTNENEIVVSFSIITTEANGLVKNIHDRMPVIFDTREQEQIWLNAAKTEDVIPLLRAVDPEKMLMIPVSALVNSTKNDFPELHVPVSGLTLF